MCIANSIVEYSGLFFDQIIATGPNGQNVNSFGCRLLPSISGKGVYMQYKQNFHHFSCDTSSCQWQTMEQTLPIGITYSTFVYLPPTYNCN